MLNPDEHTPVETAFSENTYSLKRFLQRFLQRPEDVDDVMHDAFLRAYRTERTRVIDQPKAFLFKIARNLALNEIAKSRHRQTETMADFSALAVSDSDTPESRAVLREDLGNAFDLVNQLPARVREVFLLRKLHGLSQKEIAVRLGIAESTVEKHLAKGLLKMNALAQPGSRK